MTVSIVWLRKDLRLEDNPALFYACKESEKVILLYILDNTSYDKAQKWWLFNSLRAFQNSLENSLNGNKLTILYGNEWEIIQKLAKEHTVEKVFWNRRYEPANIKIDTQIKSSLEKENIIVKTYKANLLFEPWEIKNNSGTYFKVFTPFWKKCTQTATSESFGQSFIQPCLEKPIINAINSLESIDLPTLEAQEPAWAKNFAHYWQVGEQAANEKFKNYINDPCNIQANTQGINKYAKNRDIPSSNGTSLLSPHLHFGEISVRKIWHMLTNLEFIYPQLSDDITRYLTEIGWREFSYYILYHFPQLENQNFRPEFNNFEWENNEKYFQAWKNGQTGYPMVDSGMRELWKTGTMHNRVRMVVASFLTKHLLIDWRKGAEWFLYTLLDADLASNSSGWQWVAGCGVDAAPYFRIFNPVLQGQRFDPEGVYVRKWCPEISKLSNKFIHNPWLADEKTLKEAGIKLGRAYPFPIIDHDIARKKALDNYTRRK